MPRPDEGLIHAWLDGQLPPEEAARIEELAATDAEWAAAVAEARGLVAASSRILSALDRVPAGVVPRRTATHTTRLPWWTKIAAAVVVVAGGSVVVLQNAPQGRMSVQSTEQRSAQPAPDTQKAVAEVPVTSPPVPTATKPRTTARVPATAPTAGVPAGAVIGSEDAPALRRKALAPQPITPPSPSAPRARTIVAREQKTVLDAERVVAELPTAKSMVAKVAPGAMQNAAPSAAPLSQQAAALDLAQVQSALPAQRAAGGVMAARRAQGQQATLCFRLLPDSTRSDTAIVMRVVRTAGDTLHLVPVEPNAAQRAWLVLRDGMRGVMTTSGDLHRATRILGTPATCPAP